MCLYLSGVCVYMVCMLYMVELSLPLAIGFMLMTLWVWMSYTCVYHMCICHICVCYMCVCHMYVCQDWFCVCVFIYVMCMYIYGVDVYSVYEYTWCVCIDINIYGVYVQT